MPFAQAAGWVPGQRRGHALVFVPAGLMEGSPPAEARRLPRPPRQHGQGGGRSPAPPERPEAARGPHAVLEGKVKALKEKRGGRPGTPAAAPERPSPKKPRSRRGKAGAEAEPRAQLRTYLTDGLLDGGEPAPGSPPAPGTPGLWRVPAPRGDVPGAPELPPDKGGRSWRSASLRERPSRDEEARTPLRDRGRPSVSPPRAESWERLSLAERVERNRRLLQEVLGLAAPGLPSSPCSSPASVCLSPRQGAQREAERRPRDGGSLSDSSSGDSSCGRPRRPRGPSPSRVRFEDESARDVEVRYLERLQLRHRRSLGSALPSPEPAGSRQPGDGAGQPKARSADLVVGGKCSACGSFLGAAAGRGANGQAAPDAAKSSPAAQSSVPGDSRGPSAAQTEPKIRPLGPGGSPLWILPSRQRIHTEKIKETYIGDVTYIDEVDSALESTDTSDGCRTDSEEAGPRSPHLRGHRDPHTRGHRAPRAAPQPESRVRKGMEPGRPVSRKGSGASASGLKKLLCSLSQSTKQRLGRFRCYSMEQLPAPGGSRRAAPASRSHRPCSPCSWKGGSGPQRSLSVEDIGAPGQLRAVGRVVEVFPDGTSQLELQRPPHGAFGFSVTSGHGRPDTGVYVQEMADAGTAKLYAGLLGVGDEILQVNGAAVSGLGLARIRELLLQADTLSLRVLRHRPAPR
ncbi:hypothetical protein DUI87_14483 [Hirundo rustica rustica]|uniref:PDZ domain-containing protein n=1 Tax=Hirundo rustica rustica TaxID=333673 RepID=A0A3M0K4W6_HIRRU|nr:hypothetical protein DUI87_14483 [Hirundo rustica rustica]